jgi:hypothetical protein
LIGIGLLGFMAALPLRAEEIWLFNDKRIYGLVEKVTADGKIAVFLPSSKQIEIPLSHIISIHFLGRNALLIQSGTQEFRLTDGSTLRGQILGNTGNKVQIDTAMAGILDMDLAYAQGFLSLPMVGLHSLKAEELVLGETTGRGLIKDLVIDRRGSEVAGVIRSLERTTLNLDIDDLLQVKPLRILYIKGVRLADATRRKLKGWTGDVRVSVQGRDNSRVLGELSDIRFNQWAMNVEWHPQSPVDMSVDEISLVRVLGGRVQYLSQLQPVAVTETTVLVPPQPYQLDRNCQRGSLFIAGKRYPWGIGVHADSELTFAINKQFKEFRADIGIDSSAEDRGSVIFEILGDGKSIYRSPVVRGTDKQPRAVNVPIVGLSELTLKVTNADDLDLGDIANWGAARVLKAW